MTMTFDPNDQKPPYTPEWATYIPRRRPDFKVHKQINHAKSAVLYHGRGILYQFVDGEWKEQFRTEGERPENCDLCGASVMKTYQTNGRRYNQGRRRWKKGKLNLETVCWDCQFSHRFA